MDFDETKAIKAINEALVEAGRQAYADPDEILNVIDMIWDYYEANGLLEIDDDSDEDPDMEQDLIDYVARMVKKDKDSAIALDDIPLIVRAELAYEDSLL